MPIKTFTRTTTGALATEIEEALRPIADKHGITIRHRGASFAGGHATVKIECSITDANGVAQTPEADAFKQMATLYGLEPSDLGKEIVAAGGQTGVIVGLKSRSTRYPILVRREDGRLYKWPAATVKAALAGRKQDPARP